SLALHSFPTRRSSDLINTGAFHALKNFTVSRNIFVSLIIVLFLYLTCTGGENNTGPLWLYVLPPFLFYFANIRAGVILSLGMLRSEEHTSELHSRENL